jgi:hypothetical protein
MPAPYAARRPRRITITIPEAVFTWIFERSDEEGRSASNFAAYVLERAFDSDTKPVS